MDLMAFTLQSRKVILHSLLYRSILKLFRIDVREIVLLLSLVPAVHAPPETCFQVIFATAISLRLR